LRKFTSRAKFEKGRIVCCSQTKCVNCSSYDKCEELDFYIKSPFEDPSECMAERSYKKKNGRTRQTKHVK